MEIDSKTIKPFKTAKAFSSWLAKNHEKSPGLWLRIYKKASGTPTVSYAEALDEALCYGWIDGQKQSYDADSYLQRFTPRRPKGGWSKINTQHIARLSSEGRLRPSGQAQVDAAKQDGRWAAAYDSPKNAKPPQDFLDRLAKHKKAQKFFESLSKANVYAIVYRLQTAKKPETREKRLVLILEMLKKGQSFH